MKRLYRLVLSLALASTVAAPVRAADAADTGQGAFPALERPALLRRSAERAVLLAVAQAGTRLVAVGERGTVVLSDDGGRQWRQARSVPVSVTLTALRFVDAREGWAVGHGAVILHTRDGGDSWAVQANGRSLARTALDAAQTRARQAPDDATAAHQLKAAQLLVADGPLHPLLDLHFVDPRHGIVVGAYNLAFETRDGGATWHSLMDRLPNPRGLHLNAVGAAGPQSRSIFIVGEQGLMLRSQDGGRHFEALQSSYAGSWFCLAATADGGLLVAGLKGHAMHSSDAGQRWTPVAGAAPVTIVDAVAMPDGRVLLTNQAGQLLTTRGGSPLVQLTALPLPPTTDVLPLADGTLLTVGLNGPLRLPAPGAGPGASR